MGMLLADCGNTRVKLARPGESAVAVAPAELAAAVADCERVVAVGLHAATHAALAEAAGERLQTLGRELALPQLGQYASCGHDRVCAGIGAVARGGPAVVIDAGTATTVTAWREQAGRAIFAGGLILPGAQACADGLAAAAPALPQVQPAPGIALQHETPGAIAAALGIGYPAMVQACVAGVVAESEITT